MNKLVVGSLIFAAGITIGYKVGKEAAKQDYAEWQRNHKFSCWTPKKTPERPGDYPQVFVIDKRGAAK